MYGELSDGMEAWQWQSMEWRMGRIIGWNGGIAGSGRIAGTGRIAGAGGVAAGGGMAGTG